MDITFDLIAANVGNARTSGAKVEVDWVCPATGKAMGRSESYMAADHSVGNEMAASVKRGAAREAGYGIASFFGSLLGGAAGRVARDAVQSGSSRVNSNVSTAAQYTEKSRRGAIVEAFKSVEKNFTWSEKEGRFVAP